MRVLSITVSAVLLIGINVAGAQTIDPRLCQHDLADTWSRMEEMVGRLKSAALGAQHEKCETYRFHANVVRIAREVFDRCKVGRDRLGSIAQMDGALDDINSITDRECSNGLGPLRLNPRIGSD